MPNAETVAKNAKNAIPPKSWRPVPETPGDLRFLRFLQEFQHFALSGLGLLGFSSKTHKTLDAQSLRPMEMFFTVDYYGLRENVDDVKLA